MASFVKDIVKDIAGGAITGALNNALGLGGGPANEQGFNVQKAVSAVNKSGVAKTAHFEVQIIPPPNSPDLDMAVSESIMYRAETVDLPGRSVQTIDHKFTNYGPLNKVPYASQYGDVGMSIILSEDMREKEYFEIWQNKIVNTGSFEVQSNPNIVPQTDRLSRSKFNNRYHNTYIGSVVIRQFGADGSLRSVHTLKEAFPIVVNPISMNWGDDNMARLSVAFSYRYYNSVFLKQDQPGLGFGFGFKLGKGGLTGSLRLPGIGTAGIGGPGGFTANLGPLKKRIVGAIL